MLRFLLLSAVIAWPANGQQKVAFENDYVRAIDIHVAPGVFEEKHSHARGVTIALSAYENETVDYPSKKTNRRQVKFGEVRWAEPVTHEARNTGSTDQHVIRVELKQDAPAKTLPGKPDPLDSLIVCKDTQKLIFENEYVRVIEERVPPGLAQPKHRHRHGMLIPLANSEIESVDDPDGKPVQRQLHFGDAGWREPVVHSVKNIGKTELLNVRIEIK